MPHYIQSGSAGLGLALYGQGMRCILATMRRKSVVDFAWAPKNWGSSSCPPPATPPPLSSSRSRHLNNNKIWWHAMLQLLLVQQFRFSNAWLIGFAFGSIIKTFDAFLSVSLSHVAVVVAVSKKFAACPVVKINIAKFSHLLLLLLVDDIGGKFNIV